MSMNPVSQGATQSRAPKRKLEKSKPKTPFELKREEDLEESDFSIYDNDSEPYVYACSRFVYMNKVMIHRQKLITEYRKWWMLNRSLYDASNIGLLCGVRPFTITDELRPRLIELCNLALDKFNADNQGANFVFHDLVKSTFSPISGSVYYITFEAKDVIHPSDSATRTFQAKVWDKDHPRDAEPVVSIRVL